jgi:RHS repeat-associated protein
MRYDYDLLGTRIHQTSMEAGERWMLNDVTGKPIYSWDSREHTLRTTYDALRRPIEVYLREIAGAEIVVQRSIYGDSQPSLEDQLTPEEKNLRGKVVKVFDGAGIVTSDDYDFKGNLKTSKRKLAVEYKKTLDWSNPEKVDCEKEYVTSTTYDALNRPLALTTPDKSVVHPKYNEANLLERLDANLRGAADVTPFVTDIDYNAKGQRLLIAYNDNKAVTEYDYDWQTFRLTHLKTTRPNFAAGERVLQDLNYTYDPAGNITTIRDEAQQAIYFKGQVVEAHNVYTYDAIYRLIDATGREHIGQVGQSIPPSWDDHERVGLAHPHDGQAMRRYAECYEYDEVGNFLRMIHTAANGSWTRTYAYNETSLLEAGKNSNRLSRTQVGTALEPYAYDAHGNMTAMPHLSLMAWDYRDQLSATARQTVTNGATPETTYYVYDAQGLRVRKVTERQATSGQTATLKSERVYLGSYEIYREYNEKGNTPTLERETLHIMDDKQRVALVETKLSTGMFAFMGKIAGQEKPLISYQFGNHLGSASLEFDDNAQIISYEEYAPYGNTSYQAVRSQTETPKRYRYAGKERDEESGLYYHGARYCIAWLGKWTSCDPAGFRDGVNLYCDVGNNPIKYIDPTGCAEVPDLDMQNAQKLNTLFHDQAIGLIRNEADWEQAKKILEAPWAGSYDPNAMQPIFDIDTEPTLTSGTESNKNEIQTPPSLDTLKERSHEKQEKAQSDFIKFVASFCGPIGILASSVLSIGEYATGKISGGQALIEIGQNLIPLSVGAMNKFSSAGKTKTAINALNNEPTIIYKVSPPGRTGSVLKGAIGRNPGQYVTTDPILKWSAGEIKKALDLEVGELYMKYAGPIEIAEARTTWGNLELPYTKWDSPNSGDFASIGYARPPGLTAAPGSRFASEFTLKLDVPVANIYFKHYKR